MITPKVERARERQKLLYWGSEGQKRGDPRGGGKGRASSPTERDTGFCSAPRTSSCSPWLGASQPRDRHAMSLKPVAPDPWKADTYDRPLEPWGRGHVAGHPTLPGVTCSSATN